MSAHNTPTIYHMAYPIFLSYEDASVYVWHRETGVLIEVLKGHGEGSVNSVAWNPKNERMLASCSDDHTIRIWEPDMAESSYSVTEHPLENGKGKNRQISNGWDSEMGSGSSIDG